MLSRIPILSPKIGLLSALLIVSVPSNGFAQNKSLPSAGSDATTTKAGPSSATAVLTSRSKNETGILIGNGDLLEVSVYGAPDFDKQVRVDSSGMISLPMVGEVNVAGLAVHDAERLLEKRLSDGGYFVDPHVSIFEKEYSTQGISVLGEVQKPGIYPLLGERKLFDIISAAGGTTPKAGKIVTITHRNHPQQPETVTISYEGDGSPTSNVNVFPGDTVVVSKAGIVYVVGDVRQPSGFVLEKDGLTILQAIAMAQGTNPTASLSSLRLIRKTSDGHQEMPVDMKKILEAKAPDLVLQADDIVFVPISKSKSAAKRGFEAVIQAATGVAIYRR